MGGHFLISLGTSVDLGETKSRAHKQFDTSEVVVKSRSKVKFDKCLSGPYLRCDMMDCK